MRRPPRKVAVTLSQFNIKKPQNTIAPMTAEDKFCPQAESFPGAARAFGIGQKLDFRGWRHRPAVAQAPRLCLLINTPGARLCYR